MFFFGKSKKNIYADTARILSEQGYSDEYMAALKKAEESAKTPAQEAEGKSYTACALLFRGELDSACAVFAETDYEKLPALLKQSHAANYMLCLFLKKKYSAAENIYETCNRELLNGGGLLMRRSLGIHEYILNNYDAALIVFIKAEKDERKSGGAAGASSGANLMLDICIVKTLIKLDMYDKAAEYSEDFGRYDNMKQTAQICRNLKKEIFDKLNGKQKVKMVKNKKNKR